MPGRTDPAQQTGASLIEVLVSIVVLSLGLLGVAGLLVKSQQGNQAAYYRSQATVLAYDIIDRMRANRATALASGYNVAVGSVTGSGMAGADLADWKANLAQALPGGDGSVSVDNQGNTTVIVEWQDRRGVTPIRAITMTDL